MELMKIYAICIHIFPTNKSYTKTKIIQNTTYLSPKTLLYLNLCIEWDFNLKIMNKHLLYENYTSSWKNSNIHYHGKTARGASKIFDLYNQQTIIIQIPKPQLKDSKRHVIYEKTGSKKYLCSMVSWCIKYILWANGHEFGPFEFIEKIEVINMLMLLYKQVNNVFIFLIIKKEKYLIIIFETGNDLPILCIARCKYENIG